MAANESTKYTHFSNVEIGTANGGGGLKVGGVQQNLGLVQEIAAATTLTAADSGKTIVLTGIVGYAITLPAPAAGLKYKFIVQDLFATTDWVITATGAIMYGSVMELSTVQAVAGATTINLELAADTIGDWVQVESDGTNWYVSGAMAQAASVTPA
jgi:hypothetical protein